MVRAADMVGVSPEDSGERRDRFSPSRWWRAFCTPVEQLRNSGRLSGLDLLRVGDDGIFSGQWMSRMEAEAMRTRCIDCVLAAR